MQSMTTSLQFEKENSNNKLNHEEVSIGVIAHRVIPPMVVVVLVVVVVADDDDVVNTKTMWNVGQDPFDPCHYSVLGHTKEHRIK